MRSSVGGRYLFSSGHTVEYPLIAIEDGIVTSIRSLSPDEYEKAHIAHRFSEAAIVPAYLDIHMHGCGGRDVMEATPEAIADVSTHLARHGVGAYLPTTVTSTTENTLRALSGLRREIKCAERRVDGRAGRWASTWKALFFRIQNVVSIRRNCCEPHRSNRLSVSGRR